MIQDSRQLREQRLPRGLRELFPQLLQWNSRMASCWARGGTLLGMRSLLARGRLRECRYQLAAVGTSLLDATTH